MSLFGFGAVFAAVPNNDLTALTLEQLLDVQVVAASRFSQKASDAPSAVTSISAEEIRVFGYRNLADIIQGVRGFVVTSDREYNYVGARGFAPPGDYNDRLLVMVDGNRLNDSVYDQAPIGGDFPLDIDLIDHIEIVRGPSSSVYGANALFGVINIITKSGGDINGQEIALSGSSFRSGTARYSVGKKFKNGADLLLSVSGLTARGADLYFSEFVQYGKTHGITHGTDFEDDYSFFGKGTLGNFTMEAGFASRTKGNPAAISAGGFNDPRNNTLDQHAFGDLKYAASIAPQVDLTARTYVGQYKYAADYYSDPIYVPPAAYHDDGRGLWWGVESQLTARSVLNSTVSVGVEYQDAPQQDQKTYNIGPYQPIFRNSANSHRYGAFVEAEHSFGRFLTLNFGARFDGGSSFRNEVSPRFAAVLRPFETTLVKILYGSSFRPANVYERDYTYPDLQAGNLNLRPERIRTFEVIAEQYIGSSLRVSASGYSYVLKNQISQLLVDGLLTYENIMEVQGQGEEFEVEKLWSDAGRLRASISFQQTKDAIGQRLVNSPATVAKLNYSRPLFGGQWRLGAEGQSVSSRRYGTGTTGSYAVANLTLSRSEDDHGLAYAISIYNLLDKKYGDPILDDNLGLARTIIPADGRIVQAKVSLRY